MLSSANIAATLYTVREFTQTADDLKKTLKLIKEIGYDGVQLSAVGPIEPAEIRELVDEAGLVVAATHINYPRLVEEPEAVIAEHRIYDCKYVAIPSIPPEYRHEKGYYQFAEEASQAAAVLKEGGLVLGYHNHSFELEKFQGRTALEILYTESDPELFTSEIDTYWIQHGGGDPAQWMRDLKGRSPIVHLKDMAVVDGEPTFAEVGEGNLNWPSILDACREAGVIWYIVEQDTCPGDPFESLSISRRNLKELGLG
ncbi:MAG: sugar phosphate isomerase/epimerase [Firmicutes bacterium]|nr:sugar phosphate isomerase/epimerase [Bacillota bacterium]